MSASLRNRLAVVIAPLVIVAWFLWPLVPFDPSPGDVLRSLATAYALFFLARGLAFLASSSPRPAVHLALVLLFSWILSFTVAAGLIVTGLVESSLGAAAFGSLQDALWCTVAAALYRALTESHPPPAPLRP